MVLASGCGARTLTRVGAGNLKSLVVFLVLSVTAYMTMRGVLGVLRVNTLDTIAINLPGGQDIPGPARRGRHGAEYRAGSRRPRHWRRPARLLLRPARLHHPDNILGGSPSASS